MKRKHRFISCLLAVLSVNSSSINMIKAFNTPTASTVRNNNTKKPIGKSPNKPKSDIPAKSSKYKVPLILTGVFSMLGLGCLGASLGFKKYEYEKIDDFLSQIEDQKGKLESFPDNSEEQKKIVEDALVLIESITNFLKLNDNKYIKGIVTKVLFTNFELIGYKKKLGELIGAAKIHLNIFEKALEGRSHLLDENGKSKISDAKKVLGELTIEFEKDEASKGKLFYQFSGEVSKFCGLIEGFSEGIYYMNRDEKIEEIERIISFYKNLIENTDPFLPEKKMIETGLCQNYLKKLGELKDELIKAKKDNLSPDNDKILCKRTFDDIKSYEYQQSANMYRLFFLQRGDYYLGKNKEGIIVSNNSSNPIEQRKSEANLLFYFSDIIYGNPIEENDINTFKSLFKTYFGIDLTDENFIPVEDGNGKFTLTLSLDKKKWVMEILGVKYFDFLNNDALSTVLENFGKERDGKVSPLRNSNICFYGAKFKVNDEPKKKDCKFPIQLQSIIESVENGNIILTTGSFGFTSSDVKNLTFVRVIYINPKSCIMVFKNSSQKEIIIKIESKEGADNDFENFMNFREITDNDTSDAIFISGVTNTKIAKADLTIKRNDIPFEKCSYTLSNTEKKPNLKIKKLLKDKSLDEGDIILFNKSGSEAKKSDVSDNSENNIVHYEEGDFTIKVLVMEQVFGSDGIALTEMERRGLKIPVLTKVKFLYELLKMFNIFISNGYFWSDIKPANIRYRTSGNLIFPNAMDYGAWRQNNLGQYTPSPYICTPRYMYHMLKKEKNNDFFNNLDFENFKNICFPGIDTNDVLQAFQTNEIGYLCIFSIFGLNISELSEKDKLTSALFLTKNSNGLFGTNTDLNFEDLFSKETSEKYGVFPFFNFFNKNNDKDIKKSIETNDKVTSKLKSSVKKVDNLPDLIGKILASIIKNLKSQYLVGTYNCWKTRLDEKNENKDEGMKNFAEKLGIDKKTLKEVDMLKTNAVSGHVPVDKTSLKGVKIISFLLLMISSVEICLEKKIVTLNSVLDIYKEWIKVNYFPDNPKKFEEFLNSGYDV